MKHNLNIIFSLIGIFFASQLMGLFIISQYVNIDQTFENNKTVLNEEVYPFQPPEVNNESFSFIYLLIPFIIATLLVLIIIKYNAIFFWKAWFFLSITLALFLAINPFVKYFWLTLLISISLTILKKENIFAHNLTEILIYGGIAAILVPILNVISVSILLIIISLYDVFAVNKSKHMVKMAQFQSKSDFAGITFSKKKNFSKKGKSSNAMLGGGDIAFPLLFSGTILKYTASFPKAIIISLITSFALFYLLYRGKKDKFYPAMPYLTVGCFLGLILTLFF